MCAELRELAAGRATKLLSRSPSQVQLYIFFSDLCGYRIMPSPWFISAAVVNTERRGYHRSMHQCGMSNAVSSYLSYRFCVLKTS